ncbi:MAG TPA: hypothetical protein VNR68_10135 [Sphingomicrobium sp.]|nr:hypothetical protein [Sphingomicrobium sp.]
MTERTMPLLERIARVLAGAEVSANADGDDLHAARLVDAHWREHRNQAMAILHVMREPDADVGDGTDAEVWRRLIEAAIADG